MKKLMVIMLAAAMVMSLASTAFALNEEDYDNQDIFDIKEETKTLYPGVDYFFDCDWQGGDITDDFFEFYDVSVSVSEADEDNVSSSQAKKIAEIAQFTKDVSQDKYYFHFRAKKSFDYPDDDATILITVLAKDKSRDRDREDSRSWYQFELDIGYADKNDPKTVTGESYEVDNDTPIVEFDEDLDYCKLTFEDGSFYRVYLNKDREYNLGQSTDENKAIADGNPGAKLKFVSFYGIPRFPEKRVLKVYAPGGEDLYEIDDNNRLTLVATGNNDGYLGYSTSELENYVASDIPLNTASAGNAPTTTPGYSNIVRPPVTSSTTYPVTSPIISNPNTGVE